MDVNLTNISIHQPPAGLHKEENVKNDAHPAEEKKIEIQKEVKIPEKTMMDLRDVQSFLYMMIGSEIKVEQENINIGSALNKIA